jgi:AcrR family transcriptional regulator
MSTSAPDSAYHHGNLREALVAAALERLQSEGPAALGLRELARGVGVSPSAPYRHFADRQALLEAVAAEGFRRFGAAMSAAADGKPESEQLEAMARAYVRFAISAPHLFRLMFSGEIDHRRDPALAAAAKAAYASLAAAAAREDGAAPAKVAITAWAFVHGLSILLIDQQILGVSSAGADLLVEQLAHRLVAGLRATRAA